MSNDTDRNHDPDPARWQRIRELFAHLAEASPSRRARHLSLVCEDDPALREEVETLLRSHDALAAETTATADGVDMRGADATRLERIGDYRLFECLGRGGAGAVYRAEHPLRGEVALKLLPAAAVSGTVARRRFEQEARALRSLRHPALCRLHDAFVTEEQAVLVMERVRGRSLADALADGAFGWHRSLEIVGPLIAALATAHRLGVVHRDIKPGNVMLDEGGRPRLIDFGIVRFADVRLTLTGQMIGSPRYMSPEQWRAEKLDARSDQFSLGALWYELLTGRAAFGPPVGESVVETTRPTRTANETPAHTDNIAAIATRIMSEEPARLPGRAVDGVSLRPFGPVLSRMLAKRAGDRFSDLGELSRALAALVQNA